MARGFAVCDMSDGSTRVLQLTDTHQLNQPGSALLGIDTRQSLEAVLTRALSEETPDLLLLTGDVAQDPERDVYDRTIRLLESHYDGPWLWTPGNHDLADPMRQARSGAANLPADTASFSVGAWGVFLLDTHTDDQVEGHVSDAAYAALERYLSTSDAAHILVAGHHPMAPVGTPWLDQQRVKNAALVYDCCARSGRVRLYLCGHVHQEHDSVVNGLRLLAAPSTCYQFKPGSRDFALDDRPPGWRWLTLSADGTVATRVERL